MSQQDPMFPQQGNDIPELGQQSSAPQGQYDAGRSAGAQQNPSPTGSQQNPSPAGSPQTAPGFGQPSGPAYTGGDQWARSPQSPWTTGAPSTTPTYSGTPTAQQGWTLPNAGATIGGQAGPSAFTGPTAPQGPTGPTGPLPTSSAATGTATRRRTAGWGTRIAAGVALTALAFGGGAGGTWFMQQRGDASASATGTVTTTTRTEVVQGDTSAPDWTKTVAAALPSTVSITVQTRSGEAAGSGVIWDTSGHIVTNNHVVADASSGGATVTVTLSDNTVYEATIVATDPSTDLAVLKITNPPSTLVPITVGDASALKVGDPVMAIGNPLELSNTVTTGIVSALNRPVTTESESSSGSPVSQQSSTDTVVTDAIQVSAAINPGNSGGALLDADGKLVGINFSIASLGSQSTSGSIGIGFAIPADQVKNVVTQLISDGSAKMAMLGVTSQDGTGTVDGVTRLGATVRTLTSGGPAEKAGLQAGDVIVSVNGDPVTGSESLAAEIRSHPVGTKVPLVAIRDGKEITVEATLTSK